MKKKVLVDIKIECDPPRYYWLGHRTMEDYASHCEDWVKDFHDFIRDHRSQDPVSLSVERQFEDHCEFCDSVWEVDTQGCPCCCTEAIDEWEWQITRGAVA
jgi:hypothetical protein